MKELFRFNRIRPVNLIFEDEKKSIGIPLFPSVPDYLDQFYLDKDKFFELTIKLMKNDQSFIYRQEQLSIITQHLYKWLLNSSRPIILEDFQNFYEQKLKRLINRNPDFSLDDEWNRCGLSYFMKLFNKEKELIPKSKYKNYDLSKKSRFVDYQLLIKTCKLLDIFRIAPLEKNKQKQTQISKLLQSIENSKSTLIDDILELPLLLPPNMFNSLIPNFEGIDIPTHLFEEDCNCDEVGSPSNYSATIRYDLADLYVIKEKLDRYEEGDIAYIENVLAGEEKVRKHRSLKVSEDKIETETTREIYEERNHQITENFSLQEQINKIAEESLNIDAGVTVNSKLGPSADMTATANLGYKFSKSKNNSLARNYAKDILDRSVTKIQENLKQLKSKRIQREIEEKNKHTIDNKESYHRAGIYYWVNKVTHAQLFNYGKRFMVDLYVPEPASIYRKLYQEKTKDLTKNYDESLPKVPQISLDQITRKDYVRLLSKHGVSEFIDPPGENYNFIIPIQHTMGDNEDSKVTRPFNKEYISEIIPENYQCIEAEYQGSFTHGKVQSTDGGDELGIAISIMDKIVFEERKSDYDEDFHVKLHYNFPKTEVEKNISFESNPIRGKVSISITGFSTVAIQINGYVKLICKLTAEALERWKLQIRELIINKYLEEISEQEYKKDEIEERTTIKGRNPFLNRELERNELKRHIIAILMNNYFKGIGSVISSVKPCNYPEIDFEKMEKDSSIIRFFEQVFDWNYMNYLFYPSYWARKCKWVELLEEDSGDPLFDKFLTAGAARIQLPVRLELEDKFMWFLKKREIWSETGEPPVFSDDEYVSMVQELKEAKQGDYQERDGNITVTSDLTILELSNSEYYWDKANDNDIKHNLNIKNDLNRELLIDFRIYRIVKIEQKNPNNISTWLITIDKKFHGKDTNIYKHSVGAIYVGAPWEVKIPTKLVYLQNDKDRLSNINL